MSFIVNGLTGGFGLKVGYNLGNELNHVGRFLGHQFGFHTAELPCRVGEAIGQTFVSKYAFDAIDYLVPNGNLFTSALKCSIAAVTIWNNVEEGSHAATPCPHDDHRFCIPGKLTGLASAAVTVVATATVKGATAALLGGSVTSFAAAYITVKLCQNILT